MELSSLVLSGSHWFTLVHTGRRLTSPPRGGLVWLGATRSRSPPEAKPARPAPAASPWSSDKLPTCLTLSFGFRRRTSSPFAPFDAPPSRSVPRKTDNPKLCRKSRTLLDLRRRFFSVCGNSRPVWYLPIWQSSAIANMAGFTGLILRFNLNC